MIYDAGKVYIFFGRQSWITSYWAVHAEVKITGDYQRDYFGEAISSSGDINNDGIDDIVVGAVGYGFSYNDGGCFYVYFGRTNWNSEYDAKDSDVKIISSNHFDYLGCSISINQDINNDGVNDLVVGAKYNDLGAAESGAAFIFFGRTNWSSINNISQADVKLVGADEDDYFGCSLTIIQDINSDGICDIIVGAYCDDDGGTNSGCAFIFFGSNSPASTIYASNANVKLIGEDTGDLFGVSVSQK